jgi:excisionase family DNA binding protein
MDDLVTYEEAARMLGLKLGTLYAMVSQHRIPHVRLGRRLVRFSRAALHVWLQQRSVDPAA